MILNHMRNAQVAEGVRAQLDLNLTRLRDALGASVAFIARVAGGERRVEAMAAALGADTDLVVGHLSPTGQCPVISDAFARAPEILGPHLPLAHRSDVGRQGAVGVPITLSDGRLFGVLGLLYPVDASFDAEEAASEMVGFSLSLGVGLDLLHDHEMSEQRVRGMVRDVIRRQQFRPVFQPVHDIETSQTLYCEGLTRMDPDVRVNVMQLLGAAHSVGIGPELELAYARRIIEEHKRSDDALLGTCNAGAGVAVNLSEETLFSEAFDQFLTHEAEPGLIIELTEHDPVQDYTQLAGVVARLREAGVQLAVDDAGSGYTSLRHILDLKPDIIKIDQRLSARVDSDPEAMALMRSLQGYCNETGTVLVVEGIERADQLSALRQLGVRFVQGFHVGAPRTLASRTG